MKIRIKGNTLRLRLSQGEVDTFHKEERISDSINFGKNKLIYTLQLSERKEVWVDYKGGFITVNVPARKAGNWAITNQVGFAEEITLNNEEHLLVLVEKDFQCLTPRADEEDLFKNPLVEN